MNFQNKSALLLSLSVMSPMAFAGPPVAYDEWSVIGGKIDTSLSCSATGVACDTLVSDKGMLYEQVTTDAGAFLRLIITEFDANYDPSKPPGEQGELTFADESFVPFALQGDTPPPELNALVQGPTGSTSGNGPLPQGFANKQTLKDAADNFVSITEVRRSNMRQLADGNYLGAPVEDTFSIKFDQSFDDGQMQSSFSHVGYTTFATTFSDTIADPDTNVKIGSKTDIDQTLDMNQGNDPGAKQLFIHRARDGYAGTADPNDPNVSWLKFAPGNVAADYFVFQPITEANTTGVSVSGGSPVKWDEGDSINTSWVVQVTGDGVLPITYQSVTNNDATGTEIKQDSALIFEQPTGPIVWDANFGTAPTFP